MLTIISEFSSSLKTWSPKHLHEKY